MLSEKKETMRFRSKYYFCELKMAIQNMSIDKALYSEYTGRRWGWGVDWR